MPLFMCHILANEDKDFKTAVFVCQLTLAHAPAPVPYSNVCRSPIAEGLAKKWLSERYGVGVQDLEQAGYKVKSRGKSHTPPVLTTTNNLCDKPKTPFAVFNIRMYCSPDIAVYGQPQLVLSFLSQCTQAISGRLTCIMRMKSETPLHKIPGCSTDFEPVGSPASPHGVTIMREQYGVDISAHRSAMVSEADVLEATHIYCMSRRHHDSVLSLLRRDASNDHDLHSSPPLNRPPSSRISPGPPSYWAPDAGTTAERGEMPFPVAVSVFEPEVPDPWHGTMEYYRECTGIISEAVTRALEREAPGGSHGQQQPDSSSTSLPPDEDKGKPQS